MASAAEERADGGGPPTDGPAAASPSTAFSCGCAVELHPGVLRRVKVYELDEREAWRERGTGQVQLYAECAEAAAARSLTVVVWPEGADGSAVDGQPRAEDAALLRHRVDASVEYALQADTILSWTDASDGRDWALSFQDAHRCHDVLEAIADHQKDAHSNGVAVDRPLLRSPTDSAPSAAVGLRERRSDDSGDVSEGVCARQSRDDGDRTTSPADALSLPVNASPDVPQPFADVVPGHAATSADEWAAFLRHFPVASQSSLELLQQRLLDSAGDPALRHGILTLTTAADSPWLSSMYALTLRLEEANDVDALQSVFALLVALINAVHDEQLIERLFDSAHALHTFAVLEYDPAIVTRLRTTDALRLPLRRHSAALAASRCRWVLPPPPPQSSAEWASVERALHFHHRLTYAKDVVLLAHLDDAALSTFTSIAYIYRVSIVQQIHEDTTIVHQLAQAMHGHVRRCRAPAAQRGDNENDDDAHRDGAGGGSAWPVNGRPSSSTSTSTNGRSSHAHSESSAPPPACHCDPARLLTLPDEDEEEKEQPSAVSAIAPSPSPSTASSSLFRARVHFLSELLLLSKSLQPHLRSSFAESLIEHGVIDVLGAALHIETDRAESMDEDGGNGHADGRGRRSRLRASVRCVRWLFPLALSVLSALLQHCPESFRSYFLECRAVAPRASVLTSALRLLALPHHVDAAICQQALAFMRALTDTEDEEAAADGAAAIGQGLLLDDLGTQLASGLRRFAAHARPHLCRASSAGLLEWLTHAARKLSSHHMHTFMQREQVAHVVALFLTRSAEVEAVSGAAPLLLPSHPREVLCAAVRLLSSLLALHEKALWSLLVAADVFASLLRLLRSPLCRANLLQSAILDVFTAMAGQREHAPPLLQHVASLQALTDGLPHERLFVDISQRLQRHDSERAARQREPAAAGRHRRGEERASHGPAAHGSRKRKARALHSPSASDSAAAPAPSAASAGGSGGRFPLRVGRVVDDAYFLDDEEDEEDGPRAAVTDARGVPTTAAPLRQEDRSAADGEGDTAEDAGEAADVGHRWRHEASLGRAGEERRHRQWHEQVDAAATQRCRAPPPATASSPPRRRRPRGCAVLCCDVVYALCAVLCVHLCIARRSTSTERRRAPLHWTPPWETTAAPRRGRRTTQRQQPKPSPPNSRASRRTSNRGQRSA